ncbi:LLM class flavin-dependent oxidoreductase [Microbacterium tumbae]
MTGTIPLVGFLKPAGEYPAGWRHPQSPPAAGTDFAFVAEQVQRLERAGFSAVFVPDLAGLPDVRAEVLERVAVVNDTFEPITLLAALAAVTQRIGLLGTASTSYATPDEVAREFASLHKLSRGRAGWNAVTSLNDAEARNFGLDAHPEHGDRYRRAEEFVDAVRREWDAAGIAHPLIAQAGSSDAGRALASRVADLVFTRAQPLDEALAYAVDIRRRVAREGRDPASVLVLPELSIVVAPTRAEAEDAFDRVRGLLDPAVALADLEYWTGAELAGLPSDAPLPAPTADNASRGAQAEIYRQAHRENLTIGDLVRLISAGDGAVIGSPQDVADRIEEFVDAGAADGFTVSFPWLPGALRGVTELLLPELHRRGRFRADEGNSIGEHLRQRRAQRQRA